MLPPPYPVPVSVIAEAYALGGQTTAKTKPISVPLFVLSVLDAKGNAVHVTESMTGEQLYKYVYEFRIPSATLNGWRLKLVLSYNSAHGPITSEVIWTVPDGVVTPKGSGATVTIHGPSAGASAKATQLIRTSPGLVKPPRAVPGGFKSSQTPQRPNESKVTLASKLVWLDANNASQSQVSYQSYSRTWSGTRTPGFGSLKAKQLPVNPHTVQIWTTKANHAMNGTFNSASGSSSGILQPMTVWYPGATQPASDSTAAAIALKRLISNMQSGIEANIAQDLAQINQTTRLVAKSISRLTGAASALRSGNIPKAIETLWGGSKPVYRRKGGPSASKSLADNWLELQYGWKPLINDVHTAMKTFSEYGKYLERYVVRSEGSGRHRTETSSDLSSPNLLITKAGKKVIITESRVKFIVYWKVRNELLQVLAQTGFTNPVNLAWEIIPFSFVVDWFLPIGPYFESLSSWHGLEFFGGCSVKFARQWTDSALAYNATSPVTGPSAHYWGSGHYHNEWIVLDRAKLLSWPSPVLPSFKNGLASATHIANGLALLRKAFR